MAPYLPVLCYLFIVPMILSQVWAEHPNCECYIVSGPDPGYFQNYRFWDFRYVPPEPELAKDYQFSPLGNNATTTHDDDEPLLTRPVLLKDTRFADEWIIQSWGRQGSKLFPIPIVNSVKNVFITNDPWHKDATHLVLRTTRLDDYSSTAEIETRLRNILHCSVRVRLRLFSGGGILQPPIWEESVSNKSPDVSVTPDVSVRPPSGACAGIFTYYSTSSESDIEILTSDPPYRVHYANQPDYDPVTDDMIPGASTIADLPIHWTSWATHRLDWFSYASRWWVDGIVQERKSYSVPYNPSMLVINLWSDGGNWTGNMSVGDSVYMGIESIEIAYNTTSDGADISDELPDHRHPNRVVHTASMADAFLRENKSEEASNNHVELDKSESKSTIHGGCRVACRIDDVHEDGFPEVVWDYST